MGGQRLILQIFVREQLSPQVSGGDFACCSFADCESSSSPCWARTCVPTIQYQHVPTLRANHSLLTCTNTYLRANHLISTSFGTNQKTDVLDVGTPQIILDFQEKIWLRTHKLSGLHCVWDDPTGILVS